VLAKRGTSRFYAGAANFATVLLQAVGYTAPNDRISRLNTSTEAHHHRVNPRAIAMMLGMAMCFVVLETTAKWLSRSYPVPMVVWFRSAVHVGLMVVLFGPVMGTRLVRTSQPAGQLARATLMLGSTLCNFGAISFLPLAEVKAISFISPLFVSILAVWLLKERVRGIHADDVHASRTCRSSPAGRTRRCSCCW